MGQVRREGLTEAELNRTVAITCLADWTAALAALPVEPWLPTRLALVPSEPHAHALRVALLSSAPHVHAGTRFLTLVAAARAILDHAGVAHRVGEEERRGLRLRAIFNGGLVLASYRLADLRTAGWEEAFSTTIEQLEAAGLRPCDLTVLDDAASNDLATVWRALDEDAGTSWTSPRIIAEAHALLVADRRAWPFDGPVLAAVTAGLDAIDARFVMAIPRCTLGALVARPVRARAIERVRVLFGDDATTVFAPVAATDVPTDELQILTANLFTLPHELADPGRVRSSGPDGTVTLELYGGMADELEAAVHWAAVQITDYSTPLQDIAIIVPVAEPLAALVADRLAELRWPGEAPPIHLACGRPATATTAGARVLATVRALESYLAPEELLELLPRLRPSSGDGHLSPKQSRELLDLLGTIGGSRTRPHDAVLWGARLGRLDAHPQLALFGGALAGLVELARSMLAGADLPSLWRGLRDFVETSLITSRDLPEIVEPLDHDLRALGAESFASELHGRAGLGAIGDRLRALRIDVGRYGEPAIYVGTIASAAGLPFTAVRVIGLAESSFPGTLRRDAILDPGRRHRLPTASAISDEDYASSRLQLLSRLVGGVGARLALSAARADLAGSEREPAALFAEVGAALARPSSIDGHHGPVIPGGDELERDAFGPARFASAARARGAPPAPWCWHDRAAAGALDYPATWARIAITSPFAIMACPPRLEGVLGAAVLAAELPGKAPARALSAASVRMLLECPRRFLLERVLGFRPRREPASADRIEPLAYGTLVHRIAEIFSRAHGEAFGAREQSLPHWLAAADAIAETELVRYIDTYALVGARALVVERRRLQRDIASWIEHDWCAARPVTYVGAERDFVAVPVPTASGPLFVTGRIDRIDIDGNRTLVRDLKTGKYRGREHDGASPAVLTDLQLVLYLAVVSELGAEWNLPAAVSASYVYIDHRATTRERAFRDDADVLRAAGARWLDTALELLHAGLYVTTPDPGDCRWCPFAPICGDDTVTTWRTVGDAAGALADYRELRA